ncbi:MAG: nucleotidyltransferase family protein [Polaribacter sp.]
MTYKETLLFIGKCLTISHEEKNKIIVEKELKSEGIDWDFVVEVSTAHYVFPALYCNLKRANFLHYLPEQLVNYMVHITDLNRERNQQIIAQAKELNELLLANNITPIFLKGTSNLLEGLYEDIAERMVGDIDFLVSDDKFFSTIELLKKNQYKKTNDKLTDPYFIKHYPRIFNENRIAALEIHKDMIRGRKSIFFNYKKIYNSLKSINSITLLGDLDQLTLTVLSNQHNDYGSIYKTFSLRSTYDAYLLLVNKIKKPPIINKAFFNIINNYLFTSSYFLKSKNLAFKNTINSKIHLKLLIIKLDYYFIESIHTIFCRTLIDMSIRATKAIRFIINKPFRKYYIKKLTS